MSEITINQDYNYYLINRDSHDRDKTEARDCFVEWVFDVLDNDASPASGLI